MNSKQLGAAAVLMKQYCRMQKRRIKSFVCKCSMLEHSTIYMLSLYV